MKAHCRLCRRPVVEGSTFCEEHLQQAKVFSASFAPEDGEPAAEGQALPEVAEPPATARPTSAATRERRSTLMATTGRLELEEVVFAAHDTSPQALAYRLEKLLAQVKTRAAAHAERDADRWPQLSVYTLHDKLLARAYYTIIPAVAANPTADAPAVIPFALDSTALHEALAPQGVVFEAFARAFEENKPALLARQVQTLDVHVMTYAGLVAITRHLANQSDDPLATFVFDGTGFTKTTLDEMKGRLRHDRW